MPNDPKSDALAMAHLEAQMHQQGVGSIGMNDGHMFMFSEAYLQKMIDMCRDSGKDRLLLFVKRGKDISNQELA